MWNDFCSGLASSPIVLIVFYSVSCGVVLAALYEALQPGMLFGSFLVNIAKKIARKKAPKLYDNYVASLKYDKLAAENDLIQNVAKFEPILYPLGYCIKCMTPWFSALSFALFYLTSNFELEFYQIVLLFFIHFAAVSYSSRFFIKNLYL